jgi:hypothetical protein
VVLVAAAMLGGVGWPAVIAVAAAAVVSAVFALVADGRAGAEGHRQ